jgi:hypothetical protein
VDGDGQPSHAALVPVPPNGGCLEWTLNIPAAGRYHVTLEAAHNRNGNPFVIQVDQQVLRGFMPGTRNSPMLLDVGVLDLKAGSNVLHLSNLPSPGNVFFSVHAIVLHPLDAGKPTRELIRASIARHRTFISPKELSLPRIFSNHMVLQRHQSVPVWGRAVPESLVSVSFNGQSKEIRADQDGRWQVELAPMVAGGPYRFEISDGSKALVFEDVLVGEVWFGSGQSNMEVSYYLRKNNELKVECDEDTRQLLETGSHNAIRISAITRDHSKDPAWTILTKENCLDAPALMSSAAVLLWKKYGVPIGLVIRCESSSPACIWLSRESLESDSAVQSDLENYATAIHPRLVSDYPAAVEVWKAAVAKAKAEGKPEPKRPEAPAPPGCFTGDFDPAIERREYHGANYEALIRPIFPFAIRGIVWDQGEGGTGMAGVEQTTLLPALVRDWRKAWRRPELPFIHIEKKVHPSGLKSAMSALGNTDSVPYEGLDTANHPPDKATYARRLVEKMEVLGGYQ